MSGYKSSDAGPGSGRRGEAQACLLHGDGKAAHRDARAAPHHEANDGCLLTQSRPSGAMRTGETLPRRKIGPLPAGAAPQTGVRITCIDRAIIRTYFQTYEGGAPARRKKSEGYAKRAAAQRTWESEYLPEDLERKLTPLPAGYYRMVRGTAVILVEDDTHKVVDAVRGVAVRPS